MKIKEIISETIKQGEVYGWIDANGKEYEITDKTGDHEGVLELLVQKKIFPDSHDLINSAMKNGWIRIGAADDGYLFVQMDPKIVTKKALIYLFRIMTKFQSSSISIDFEEAGVVPHGKAFSNHRTAISYIRKMTR